MTEELAIKILTIMCQADGGCSNCVGDLFQTFLDEFGYEYEPFAESIFNDCVNDGSKWADIAWEGEHG